MATILDYLDWRGDLRFAADPFNEVDSFLFSQLSYPDLSGIVPEGAETVGLGEAIRAYFARPGQDGNYFGVISSPELGPTLEKLPNYPRYGELRLAGCRQKQDESKTEQFSALSILLPDGGVYLSFRGTDDTIHGWRENFLLALSDAIPAQRDALEYLRWAAGAFPGRLILGGHSKGGNLAVYAAAMAEEALQERIEAVYNFDGPGFIGDFFEREGYLRIRPKLRSVLPQYSMVGVLLPREKEVSIVDSQKSGPMAHNGFQWRVMGPRFLRCAEFGRGTRAFEDAIQKVLQDMDRDTRAAFIDEFFDTLSSTGAKTLTDVTRLQLQQLLSLDRSIYHKPEVHRFVNKLIEQMLYEYAEEWEQEQSAKKAGDTASL